MSSYPTTEISSGTRSPAIDSGLNDSANLAGLTTDQRGLPRFREAVARWLERRFGAPVDPDSEILPVIGSKEAIGHLPLAVTNAGDVVLVPESFF